MTRKITIVTVLLIFTALVTSVSAQTTKKNAVASKDQIKSAYTEIKPVSAEGQNRDEVMRVLQGGNLDDAAKTTVNNYLQKFFFARWTLEENASDLIKYRAEIQPLVDGVSSQQGKEFLLGRLTTYLYGFANKPDFSPACRYNAVLALGELNTGQTDGRPMPYLQALAALLKTYVNKGDGKDTASEAIRLGALLGIRRHVILGITNVQARDGQVAKLLMTIAADTPYKKDVSANAGTDGTSSDDDVVVIITEPNARQTSEPQRTVEQHNWFRSRAIDTLGYLSGAGKPTQTEIANTLLTLIENDLELPTIRYQAAYSLSRFNPTIIESPDLLKRTTQALLTLGLVVQEDGIQTMLNERSTQQTVGSMSSGGGMLGGGGGGMSGMGGMSDMSGSSSGQTQADQINNSIIQIKDGFSSITSCLLGPDFKSGGLINSEAMKNSPYHEVLTGLNKAIVDCVKFIDEGDPDAAKLRASQSSLGGMDGMSMGMSGTGAGGTAATTVKNQPKVTMKEIDDRLKILKSNIEILKNVMRSLEAGTTASR